MPSESVLLFCFWRTGYVSMFGALVAASELGFLSARSLSIAAAEQISEPRGDSEPRADRKAWPISKLWIDSN